MLTYFQIVSGKQFKFIFSNLEDNNGQMYISNCDEGVKDVLELVWITTIIPTVDTIEEAIESMK